MRRKRPSFEKPKQAWYEPRIKQERGLIEKYGLKSKKELWKAEGKIRKWRRVARELTATEEAHREEELMQKLRSLGLIAEDATLDEVLELDTEDILKRRLQTVVMQRGLARTPRQARQFVVHGHIRIDGKKVTIPSYLVATDEESAVALENERLQELVEEGVVAPQEPEISEEETEEESAAEETDEAEQKDNESETAEGAAETDEEAEDTEEEE